MEGKGKNSEQNKEQTFIRHSEASRNDENICVLLNIIIVVFVVVFVFSRLIFRCCSCFSSSSFLAIKRK